MTAPPPSSMFVPEGMVHACVEKDRLAFAQYCAEVDRNDAERRRDFLQSRIDRLDAIRPFVIADSKINASLHPVDAAVLCNVLLMPRALHLFTVDCRTEEACIACWIEQVCRLLALAAALDFAWNYKVPPDERRMPTGLARTVLCEFLDVAEELQGALRLFVIRWTPRYPTLRWDCVRAPELNPVLMNGAREEDMQRARFDFITFPLRST